MHFEEIQKFLFKSPDLSPDLKLRSEILVDSFYRPLFNHEGDIENPDFMFLCLSHFAVQTLAMSDLPGMERQNYLHVARRDSSGFRRITSSSRATHCALFLEEEDDPAKVTQELTGLARIITGHRPETDPLFFAATNHYADMRTGVLVIDALGDSFAINATLIGIWVRLTQGAIILIRDTPAVMAHVRLTLETVFGISLGRDCYWEGENSGVAVIRGDRTPFNGTHFHHIVCEQGISRYKASAYSFEPSEITPPGILPIPAPPLPLTNNFQVISHDPQKVYEACQWNFTNAIGIERLTPTSLDYLVSYTYACAKMPWWVVAYDPDAKTRFLDLDLAWAALRPGSFEGVRQENGVITVADAYFPVRLLRGSYFACPPIDQAHSHWLSQCYPRLHHFLSLPHSVKLLVDSRLSAFRLDMLKALGIEEDRIVRVNRGETVLVEKLIVPAPMSLVAAVTENFRNFYKTLTAKILREIPARPDLPSAFYIKRKKRSDQDYRRMLNEDAFSDVLDAMELPGVFLEDYTFLDEVALFANARLVVGELGAGLYNVVFSQPGCVVIAFTPDTYAADTPLPMICEALGHHLVLVPCETFISFHHHPSHSCWCVDLNAAAELVRSRLAALT